MGINGDKISELPANTTPALDDLVAAIDATDNTTKKVLISALLALLDLSDLVPYTDAAADVNIAARHFIVSTGSFKFGSDANYQGALLGNGTYLGLVVITEEGVVPLFTLFLSGFYAQCNYPFKAPNFFMTNIKSGATQAAAGAAAGEVWKTNGHATLPNNVLMIGV